MEDILGNLINKVLSYWMLIAIIFTTFMMALFRTTKMSGKADWGEACMCAMFAFGIWYCFSLFNIPEEAGVLVGTFIGYRGTHWVSEVISDKFDIDKGKQDD